MRTHSLRHLSDSTLVDGLDKLIQQERANVALIVAHIAEIESRKLHLPMGFSSMFAYCVRRLRFPEEVAFKRIRAARAARRFPSIYEALASGRVHLTGVVLLAPHLVQDNFEELLGAATHKTAKEIERLVAARFPKPDVPTRIVAMPPPAARLVLTDTVSPDSTKLDLNPVSFAAAEPVRNEAPVVEQTTPIQMSAPAPRAPVKPLAAERFAIQFTMSKGMLEKLEYAQALLSHRVPSGDAAEVFERALDALITRLEKERFAATEKPRQSASHASTDPRHIPDQVRRAVWKRDQGRCTYTSPDGQRCGERKFVEYDHAWPVALGGRATEAQIRLRCRAHNMYEAEQVLGSEFMRQKLESARDAADTTRCQSG